MKRDEFTELALSYLQEVTAYARRLSRSEWDADDLVQATYEQAFRKWQDLSELARCRAWIFRIARNLHFDRSRSTTARSELRIVEQYDSLAPVPFASPDTVERASAHELDAALSRLTDEQRDAVLLCDLWGFTYGEIAEIMDVPVGTVRSRISRSRSELLRILTQSQAGRTAQVGGKS